MTDALRHKLEVLTTRQRQHAARRDAEDAEVKRLSEGMKEILATAGVERIELDRWTVALSVQKGRSSIRADKLVARGVDPEIIADATETGAPITVLRVTEKKATA